MKGFEIQHNGKITKVAIKDGKFYFIIDSYAAGDFMDIGGIDYEEHKKLTWCFLHPIQIGDKFDIRIVDIEDPSLPLEVKKDESIRRPPSKLELFRELEDELKKKGLI